MAMTTMATIDLSNTKQNIIMNSCKDSWLINTNLSNCAMTSSGSLSTTTNSLLKCAPSSNIGKKWESAVKTKYDNILRTSNTWTDNKFLNDLSAIRKTTPNALSAEFAPCKTGKDVSPEKCKENVESDILIAEVNDNMPSYNFSSSEDSDGHRAQTPEKFLSVEEELKLLEGKQEKYQDHQKTLLVNEVSASLIGGVDFKNCRNERRNRIIAVADRVAEFDPEFMLRIALYSRQEMNIRTTSNFLLAYASYNDRCRPFLRKYFCKIVRLPTDWTEVAELYTTFPCGEDHKAGSLPTVLRRAMIEKFPEFDTYQLGKYKKDSSDKKKKKPHIRTVEPVNESEKEEDDSSKVVESKKFKLKYLIRMLHISDPAFHVMALVGKIYPENEERFRRSRLEGTWEPEKAGKRMKLPIPETWETQVSMKGNKAETWQNLIDSNKLPYMAMLRNIRNMIMADISKKHHTRVINRLCDEKAVINSRQLPFRYLSGHEVLDGIEKQIKKGDSYYDNKKRQRVMPEIPQDLLSRYHQALDSAISIAAINNLPAIAGRTVIYKNIGTEMDVPCVTSKGLGQHRTMRSVADLLCEMCTKACESCKIEEYRTDTSYWSEKNVDQIWLQQLMNYVVRKIKVDTVIVVTDCEASSQFLRFASLYRLMVNSRLLFVTISLNGSQPSVSLDSELDVQLVGFSDNILRFIAQRGHSSLLSYIDNIDTKYGLKKSVLALKCADPVLEVAESSPLIRQPRWRAVRVFISSTFVDMHGERDLLVRYVFPELRERARRLFLDLYEVDLRWGITEEESASQKMVEICLKEVSKCQIFIGILGDRYGTIPLSYRVDDQSGLEWLQDYPAGASITELEFQYAALANPKMAKPRAFFYIRNNEFMKDAPNEAFALFEEQDVAARNKLADLKKRVRSSGLELYDGYPCQWSGYVNGKYIVAELEDFGQRIINNVWNAIKKLYGQQGDYDCAEEVLTDAQSQQVYVEKLNCAFVGRAEFMQATMDTVKSLTSSFTLIAGKQGCGKTYIMARLVSMIEEDHEFAHHSVPCFIDSVQHSGRAVHVINYLCSQFKTLSNSKRRFNINEMDGPAMLNFYLQEISEKMSRVIIFIDGIELLNESDQLLLFNWIPNALPKGTQVVCSASNGTALFKNMIQKDHTLIKVKPLLVKERTSILKNILSQYGKSLTENAFNNQLTTLTFKRDCALPAYISLACQVLCEHVVFEQLDDRIQSLENTIIGLLLSIVNTAQDEFGMKFTNAFLVLLSISPEGITKDVIHRLMSIYMQLDESEKTLESVVAHTESQRPFTLARVVVEQIVTYLKAFIRTDNRDDSERLVMTINPLVRQQLFSGACGGKSALIKLRSRMHLVKAGLLVCVADPSFDSGWSGKNVEALSLISRHLFESRNYQDFWHVLCDFGFVTAKIEMGLVSELLEDYQTASRADVHKCCDDNLASMTTFVTRNQHVLKMAPHLFLQTALNYEEDDVICTMAEDRIELRSSQGYSTSSYLKVRNPVQKSYCTLTVICHKPVLCVAMCKVTGNFAVGEDNVVKVYNSTTAKVIQSFYGHVDAVTSVCYVGTDKLCSGSFDGELCLWDLYKNIRISSLSGHVKSVTSCLCDHTGLVIVSASLDRTIRTWSGKSGNHISTINASKSPISCMDLHPYYNHAVIGCWNNSIEIWNLVQCRHISKVKFLTCSVQSVKVSPDGKFIVSAMLDGNISVWSYAVRNLITMKYALAVRTMEFSPTGDLLMAGDDGAIKRWKFRFNDVKCRLKGLNSSQCSAICLINEKIVAAGYCNGDLEIFNSSTGTITKSCNVSQYPIQIICDHEGKDNILVVSTGNVHVVPLSPHKKDNILLQNSSNVTAVAAAPYGYTIITGTSSGHIYLYRFMDVYNNFLKFFCFWAGHDKRIVAAAYKPINSNKFATASTDGTVKLWFTPFEDKNQRRRIIKRNNWFAEITSHEIPKEIFKSEHKSILTSCIWVDMDCGKHFLLVLSFVDGYLIAYDDESRQLQWSVLAHEAAIPLIYPCRSNNTILTCTVEGAYKLWTYTGLELLSVEGNGSGCFGAFAKAKVQCAEENHCVLGGVKVCTPSIQGVTVGRATRGGEIIIEKLGIKEMGSVVGHSDAIRCLSVGAKDEIVSCSLDGNIKMWQLGNINSLNESTAHSAEITATVYNARFDIVLTADRSGVVVIWKCLESWTPVVKFKAHEDAVSCAAFCGPTWHFVTCAGKLFKLWKYEGQCDTTNLDKEDYSVKFISELERYDSPVTCLDYSVQTGILCCGTSWGEISPYEIKINEKEQSACRWFQFHSFYSSNQETSCIASVKCLKGSNEIIYATLNGVFGVAKINDKNSIEAFLEVTLKGYDSNCITRYVTTLAILPQSKQYRYFTLGLSDGTVIYAFYSGKSSPDKDQTKSIEFSEMAAHVDCVKGMAYSYQNKQLWTGGNDGKIKVWNNDVSTRTLQQVAEHQCNAPITFMDVADVVTVAGDLFGNVYFITPLTY